MPTDYRAYPGDRHTAHTAAQRAAKVAKARRALEAAHADLLAVCADFSANGYRLDHAERAEWSTAARAADRTRDALTALDQ